MTVPVETLVVTFFEHPVIAARADDGYIYLSIRDLCHAVGLSLSSQLRRLRADPDLQEGLRRFTLPTAGGIQEQDLLLLEFVPTWITTVNRRKASPVVQERLRYLRMFAIKTVHDAIAQGAGLPGGPSARIEDLQDLEKYDSAIRSIADWQKEVEETLRKARAAWREQQHYVSSHEEFIREHEKRLEVIEAQLGLGGTLSPAQRGQIYQMVQQWAQARMEHEQLSAPAAFAGCWGLIKTRYNVAKYEHIPAAQYQECVDFIRRAYHKVTGQELVMPAVEDVPYEGRRDD